METLAEELAETWKNGNLTDVIDTICQQPTRAASAYLTVMVFSLLTDGVDKRAFKRTLGNR